MSGDLVQRQPGGGVCCRWTGQTNTGCVTYNSTLLDIMYLTHETKPNIIFSQTEPNGFVALTVTNK